MDQGTDKYCKRSSPILQGINLTVPWEGMISLGSRYPAQFICMESTEHFATGGLSSRLSCKMNKAYPARQAHTRFQQKVKGVCNTCEEVPMALKNPVSSFLLLLKTSQWFGGWGMRMWGFC